MKNWIYTSTHGETCGECRKATNTARIYAIVRGSVASTYTISRGADDHAGTATRRDARGSEKNLRKLPHPLATTAGEC